MRLHQQLLYIIRKDVSSNAGWDSTDSSQIQTVHVAQSICLPWEWSAGTHPANPQDAQEWNETFSQMIAVKNCVVERSGKMTHKSGLISILMMSDGLLAGGIEPANPKKLVSNLSIVKAKTCWHKVSFLTHNTTPPNGRKNDQIQYILPGFEGKNTRIPTPRAQLFLTVFCQAYPRFFVDCIQATQPRSQGDPTFL